MALKGRRWKEKASKVLTYEGRREAVIWFFFSLSRKHNNECHVWRFKLYTSTIVVGSHHVRSISRIKHHVVCKQESLRMKQTTRKLILQWNYFSDFSLLKFFSINLTVITCVRRIKWVHPHGSSLRAKGGIKVESDFIRESRNGFRPNVHPKIRLHLRLLKIINFHLLTSNIFMFSRFALNICLCKCINY